MGLLTFTVVLLWWGSTVVQSLIDCTRRTQGGRYYLNYDYYPAYFANWGPEQEVEMRKSRYPWKFVPVENAVYIKSEANHDYIYDAPSGAQAARLRARPGTKFKIWCKR